MMRTAMTFLIILLLAGSALAEPIRIDNGAEPTRGSRIVELEELWEVGGEDGDLILGVVNRVLIDGDGNIYLLDGQLAEVHVISPEGELLRTMRKHFNVVKHAKPAASRADSAEMYVVATGFKGREKDTAAD